MRIAIEGNIGAGKSFYLNKLKKDGFLVYPEPIDLWSTWLNKYYKDMNKYALGLLMKILYDRHQSSKDHSEKQLVVFERSPYTTNKIFKELMYENGDLDDDEYKLEAEYYNLLSWEPDIIIYLYCDPMICQERINLRSKIPGDNDITIDYLKKLHLKHETTLDSMNCSIPIYKVNSQEDPENVYRSIKTILNNILLNQRSSKGHMLNK